MKKYVGQFFITVITLVLFMGVVAYATDSRSILYDIATDTYTIDGDLAGGDRYYGEMYTMNNTTSTGITAQSTYVRIGGIESGQVVVSSGSLNGFTHVSGSSTVLNAGIYLANGAISTNGGNNKEYHYTIGVNNVQQDNCHVPRKMGAGGDVGSIVISCILDLSANDVLTLMAENVSDGTDIIVNDFNLNWLYIGAT